jgi:hypothetical protein
MEGLSSSLVRLALLVGLIFLAYKVYTMLDVDVNEQFSSNQYAIEKPSLAPRETRPMPLHSSVVSSSGPNSPNSAPEEKMPVKLYDDPKPSDSMDDRIESADAPERLRFPERNFGATMIPRDSNVEVDSGLANVATATTNQAIQHFTPERVTGGAHFFGEVSANEDLSPNYTAF